MTDSAERVSVDPALYCREVEAYLCRKNDGHLVRIVGPAFDQVSGWAVRGVPIRVVCRGIDRYFERYYAKGPRRRPARIEFCEADVLDLFDEWKRAVGVGRAVSSSEDPSQGDDTEVSRKRGTLAAHLERVVARLTTLRAGETRAMDAVLDRLVRELDAARSGAKGLRGEAREQLLARLRALETDLVQAARDSCEGTILQSLGAEADRQLAPFRNRMPEAAYEQARRACVDRLLRDQLKLPAVAFE
ncbi:MAG: hypothetical protein HOP16_00965 [Acidobacteria bacterium]|nr:hypothetical protein [Acidobacteriota bacterium]